MILYMPIREKIIFSTKKINILWGDRNHRTVCIVRADVTEMLAEERKNKRELEDALASGQAGQPGQD